MSASSVAAARPANRQGGGGATPTPAGQQLGVQPIPIMIARNLLHSLPGGTHLSLGVFDEGRLAGALCFGSGPKACKGKYVIRSEDMEPLVPMGRGFLYQLAKRGKEFIAWAVDQGLYDQGEGQEDSGDGGEAPC